MNQLQKHQPLALQELLDVRPPLISSTGRVAAVWARTKERGSTDFHGLPIISPDRKRFEIQDLENQLSPASPDALRVITSLMLELPRSQPGDEGMTAAGYAIALADCPIWAVVAAVQAWLKHEWPIKGEQPNFNFAPSPPVLRQLVDHFTAHHHQALKGIRACPTNAPEQESEPDYARGEFVDDIMEKTGYGKRLRAIKDRKDFIAQYGFEPVGKTARAYEETKRGKS